MARIRRLPGRPPTSDLTRAEQLRAAKRAQRRRERAAGLEALELRLPVATAQRPREAARIPRFREALDRLLDDTILEIDEWPALKELAWNRGTRWIAAEEAFALYERNWRFVDPEALTGREARLIEGLKGRFGGGVINA